MKVESLLNSLWTDVALDNTLRVFSLQDAAASPRIYPNMVLSLMDHACLYDGRLPPVLAQAAPYLVRLAAAASYTRWFLEQGWGRHWGVQLQTHANLLELRKHFQRLLLVQDETGAKFHFRFFDPRVVRLYLPTCDSKELRSFFGPVDRFFVAGETGAELLVYSVAAGRLSIKHIPMDLGEGASANGVISEATSPGNNNPNHAFGISKP